MAYKVLSMWLVPKEVPFVAPSSLLQSFRSPLPWVLRTSEQVLVCWDALNRAQDVEPTWPGAPTLGPKWKGGVFWEGPGNGVFAVVT